MILVYAFSNRWGTNISSLTLNELSPLLQGGTQGGFVFQKILSFPNKFFEEYVHNKQYSAIIGLGDFNGDFDKIRIETQAQNLFGRHSIIQNGLTPIKLDLPLLENIDPSVFIYGQNMGNYHSNWIAFQIQSYINQKKLTCYHLFFHLPQKSNSSNNAHSLANLLIDHQVIQ